jgi:GNAT superfamily N-acetyltransferase
MTAKKTAPCLAGRRPLGTAWVAGRTLSDCAPRHESLTDLVRQPWAVRTRGTTLVIRPAVRSDLYAVARMHTRCSPETLLNRYRAGGCGPAIAALERLLRQPLVFVAVTFDSEVVALGTATVDLAHNRDSAEVGILVADSWQRRGIGRELMSHVAAAALVCGYTELIGYMAASTAAPRRLMTEVGHTRLVPDFRDPHLHTFIPESAALGLGAVRERLAS